MTQYRLISADSHVNEPPDLWVSRVDKKYRERAPRLAVDLPGKEGAYFLNILGEFLIWSSAPRQVLGNRDQGRFQ